MNRTYGALSGSGGSNHSTYFTTGNHKIHVVQNRLLRPSRISKRDILKMNIAAEDLPREGLESTGVNDWYDWLAVDDLPGAHAGAETAHQLRVEGAQSGYRDTNPRRVYKEG